MTVTSVVPKIWSVKRAAIGETIMVTNVHGVMANPVDNSVRCNLIRNKKGCAIKARLWAMNELTTRLLMNMIQRQLGLIPSIVRKEDKGEYIQSLVDSRENDDSTITQDTMLRHHIANLNRRVSQYQENDGVRLLNKTLLRIYYEIVNKPENQIC